MRAGVFIGGGRVRVEDVSLPEPGPEEVRLRVEGCGICGSDMPVWEGRPWFEYPRAAGAPGHETWGYVDALGEAVESVSAGDRVAALSYRGYAEYDIAHGGHLVPLTGAVSAAPFPGEPLSCAMNVFERAVIAPGDTVAVLGIGFLGGLLVALAAEAGAHVIAIARRPEARETALAMGASATIPFEAASDAVKERTDGRMCDVVIEATGAQGPLDLAAELTRIRGRLVIAGYHQDGRREVDMQLWNWRGLDVINAHERDPGRYVDGMRRAVAAVASGRLDPTLLYTHRYSLEDLARAFAELADHGSLAGSADGGPHPVKALVYP